MALARLVAADPPIGGAYSSGRHHATAVMLVVAAPIELARPRCARRLSPLCSSSTLVCGAARMCRGVGAADAASGDISRAIYGGGYGGGAAAAAIAAFAAARQHACTNNMMMMVMHMNFVGMALWDASAKSATRAMRSLRPSSWRGTCRIIIIINNNHLQNIVGGRPRVRPRRHHLMNERGELVAAAGRRRHGAVAKELPSVARACRDDARR